MTRNEVIDLMSKVKGLVSRKVKSTSEKVLTLSYAYKRLGKKFTFDSDADLDAEVNKLLLELSNELLNLFEKKAKEVISGLDEDEDEETILAWVKRSQGGLDLTTRVDSYSSHLKWILEGWLAIGFANEIDKATLLTDIISYLGAPSASSIWKIASGDGEYLSQIIREGGYGYGKGINKNPIDGITLAGKGVINETFHKGSQLLWKRQGAVGYVVHRGSNYPCSYCDSLCGIVWPINELVLPAHPNCVCYMTPVYKNS